MAYSSQVYVCTSFGHYFLSARKEINKNKYFLALPLGCYITIIVMFLLLLLHYYHHLRVMFSFIFKIIFTTSGLLSSYGALCQTQTRSCFNHHHSASTHLACRRRCTASGSFSSIRFAIFDASTDKTSSCATFHHSASTGHPCRP